LPFLSFINKGYRCVTFLTESIGIGNILKSSFSCFCFLIFANICQDNIIIIATQFGERIRELRTNQNLLLRQLASQLDEDTSIISKVERGDRQLKKEQIPLLAQILKADVEELQTLWLADQIYAVVKDEKFANEAMQVADKKINFKNRKQ
jgi:transcriptional regulator with XRE-family HTH domain